MTSNVRAVFAQIMGATSVDLRDAEHFSSLHTRNFM